MRNKRRVSVTALTAAIALSLGAIPVALVAPAILASGEGTTTISPAAISAGALTLSTNSAEATVQWNGLTQKFNGGQQCAVTNTSGSDLLRVIGSVGGGEGAAGFRDGAIGVFEFSAPAGDPNNASQCFRVDSGSFTDSESLTIKLGDAAAKDAFGPLLAKSATVKVEAKSQNLTITASLLKAGSPDVDFPLPTWTKLKSGALVPVPALTSSDGFDGIRLTSTGGSFSLRGATFDLDSEADATFCNPGNPNGGTSTYTEGTTTVRYLGNADASNSCFLVQLTSGDRAFQWLKPTTVSQDAQFVFDHVWTLPNPPTPDFDLPKSYVNFELPGRSSDPDCLTTGPGTGCHELTFCPVNLYTGGQLALVNQSVLATLPDLEVDDPTIPGSLGTQYSCIANTRATQMTPTGLEVTDKIFLVGDAAYRN